MKMVTFKKVFILACVTVSMAIAKMEEGKYRIENLADTLHITTEGGNTPFARIVGENWHNFGEQKWTVEKKGLLKNTRPQSWFFSADKFRTNNALSFFRDPAQKYPIPQSWAFLEVKEGYQIQNQRTGLCLISSGRRREILEGKCDQYLRDRHWKFIPVA